MLSALTLACVLYSGQCKADDVRRVADAIDASTDDERLRAIMVIDAGFESGLRVHPRPVSWDARIGLAVGPWQMWSVTQDTPLITQARRWLWMLQRGGLASLCASRARAYRIAAAAQRLLERARAA